MGNAILLLLLSAGVASAQSADAQGAFEVVSIKPSAPRGAGGVGYYGCKGGPRSTDPGRITCTNTGLPILIVMAYGVSGPRISGMSTRVVPFDIVAKLPAGATPERVPQMWRQLLAERFKLAVHREKKEVPVYLLVVAKGGLKIKEAVENPAHDASEDWSPGNGPARFDKDGFPILPAGASMTSYRNDTAHWAASKLTMEQLAGELESRLNASSQIRLPVVDGTGLKGKYDIRLTWPLSASDEFSSDMAFRTALEGETGLKVERKRALVEILVVDHAETLPTEN